MKISMLGFIRIDFKLFRWYKHIFKSNMSFYDNLFKNIFYHKTSKYEITINL